MEAINTFGNKEDFVETIPLSASVKNFDFILTRVIMNNMTGMLEYTKDQFDYYAKILNIDIITDALKNKTVDKNDVLGLYISIYKFFLSAITNHREAMSSFLTEEKVSLWGLGLQYNPGLARNDIHMTEKFLLLRLL